MPPLKNIKHEKFARAVVENPSYSAAYKEVYKQPDAKLASDSGSRLLSDNVGVKNRVIEIMNESRLGLAPIVGRLSKWVYDDDSPAQSMDAIKTGLKLHGALDSDDKSGMNMQNIQINIATLTPDSIS